MQYWVGYFLEDFYPFRKGDGINISTIQVCTFDDRMVRVSGFYMTLNVDFDIPIKLIDIKQEEECYESKKRKEESKD